MPSSDPFDIEPLPIGRNLDSIFEKYRDYNEKNTVVISNFTNPIGDFQRNDLVIPKFDPKLGRTDFLDDKHMSYVHGYIKFLFALDQTVGDDVRVKMEASSYRHYIKRLTKSLRVDNYGFNRNLEPEF